MNYPDDMDDMFERLTDLAPQQRDTIKERYRFLMNEYRRRLWMYAVLFYVLRITMTVGSLTVPALLSLSVSPDDASLLKWLTWAISLAVTTANGLITLFKVDKRFFMLHSVAERLRTETWQFLSLSGRYSGHYGGDKPTHANQYVYYTSQLEKVRMKHIEEEFVRQADMGDAQKHTASANTGTTTATPNTSAANVPSPLDNASPAAIALRRRESVLSPMPPQPIRRESTSTVGSREDAVIHVAETSLSLPGQIRSMSSAGIQGEPLLLRTSDLSDVAPEPRRAPVQSGPLQSKPADSGDP